MRHAPIDETPPPLPTAQASADDGLSRMSHPQNGMGEGLDTRI